MTKLSKLNWLWTAAIGTVVYLGGLALLIGWNRIIGFFITKDLNEFGDFLAGVFAPLAFLWLIAAVITQRQELNETRDQFEENQRVVDAQMETIKAQNELLSLQHTQAQESAKQTYKLNLFDKRFEIYDELQAIGIRIYARAEVTENDRDQVEKLRAKSSFVFKQEIEAYLGRVLDLIDDRLDDWESWRATWGDDPYGNVGVSEPQGEEADKVREKLLAQVWSISNALSMGSLQDQMWSSLRVTDE